MMVLNITGRAFEICFQRDTEVVTIVSRTMPNHATNSRVAAVEETWRRTLDGIPTLIGRLVYLSSLRTGDAGLYQHYGLSQRLGEQETSAMLGRSHVEAFQSWLSLDLEAQKRQVEEYLFGGEGNGAKALASWIALEPWALWIPETSRDVERELYRGDMGIVLELLRREAGVDRRDPDS